MGFNLAHITNEKLNTSLQEPKGFVGELKVSGDNEDKIYGLEQSFGRKTASLYDKAVTRSTEVARKMAVVSDGVVLNNDTHLMKYDNNGQLVWEREISSLDDATVSITAITVDEQNNIYVGGVNSGSVGGKLISLDEFGNTLWVYRLPEPTTFNAIFSMKTVGNHIYLASRRYRILKLNLDDQSVVWERSTDGKNVGSIEISDTGKIFVVLQDFTNSILELGDSTGEVVGTIPIVSRYGLLHDLKIKGQYAYGITSVGFVKIDLNTEEVVSSNLDADFIGGMARLNDSSNSDNLYVSTPNHFIKVNLTDFNIVYKLETSNQLVSVVEKDGYVYTYGLNGEFKRVSSDLSLKGATPFIKNKPLNTHSDVEIYDNINGFEPVAMLHNHYLMRKDGEYYLFPDGLNGNKIKLTLPSTYETTFKWANFVQDYPAEGEPSNYRLIVNVNNRLYHNKPVIAPHDVNRWVESNVWGLPNMVNPIDNTTKVYKGKTRYKAYFPDTSRHHFNILGSTQHMSVATDWDPNYRYTDSLWIGTYSLSVARATPVSVFMTKDGKDIYMEYQYGVNRNNDYKGQDIDGSSLSGTIPSDLKFRVVEPIIPNKDNKEPIDVFSFKEPVSVNNITVLSDNTIRVSATNHGLTSRDVIHFFSDSTADNTNNWIKPNSYTALLNNNVSTKWADATTLPMGNGKIYRVTRSTDDTFTLQEAIGNPHNHLYCVHVHSLDVVPNGIVVSTGEEGETSNLTFLAQHSATGSLSYLPEEQKRVFGEYAQLHLTANPERSINGAIQRSLGFYMEEDYFLFASDHGEYTRNIEMPEGRSPLGRRSTGVFRGNLSDLDDWSKTEVVLQMPTLVYMFKHIHGTFIATGTDGQTWYSMDKGKTWHYIYNFEKMIREWSGASLDGTEFIIGYHYFKINK